MLLVVDMLIRGKSNVFFDNLQIFLEKCYRKQRFSILRCLYIWVFVPVLMK